MKKIIVTVLFSIFLSCQINAKCVVNNQNISNIYKKTMVFGKKEKSSELKTQSQSEAQTQASQLSRLVLSGGFRCKSFESKCFIALEKYKNKTGDVVHTPYVQIYQALMSYYFDNKQYNEMYKCIFDDILTYDPRTLPYFCQFLWEVIEKPTLSENDKKNLAKTKCAIDNYDKTNPPFNYKVEFFKLNILKVSGEDIFNPALQYLEKYPTNKNAIKTLILLRNTIDYDNSEQIKKYYKLLTYIAVKQPTDKSKTMLLGFILKEKKKLKPYITYE